MYSMSRDEYKKLLHENTTKSYKIGGDEVKHAIDDEAKLIAVRLGIQDRAEICTPREAFITLKDHKPEFWPRPTCRLINPAKSEIGIVSKKILETLNSSIRSKTELLQWRSTQAVIDWFTALPNREGRAFMKFDIVEFYPSITEGLLNKAIKFAKLYHPVTDSDIEIIRHARRSVLFSNQDTWVKAKGANFDVTMGAYDGAEVCELVGLFLLSKLSKRFGKEYIGLYRDDGLSATSFTGPQADRARKDIIEIFRKSELRVTVEIQLVQTDFLDINLDLRSGRYWPYRKPNNEPLYINASSNHYKPRIQEEICTTERLKNAAIPYMSKILNNVKIGK